MERERIEAALRRSRADYTEIRIERKRTTRIVFHGKRLETVSTTIDEGGIVRALLRRNGWGISTFNSLETLEERVEQAYQNARLVQAEEPISLAEVPPAQDEIRAQLGRDFRQVPLEEKKELIQAYNEILLSFPKIVDTQATYADQFITVIYANSEGAFIVEERPMVTAHLVATARDGSNVQRAADGLSVPAGYEAVLGQEEIART
ncbi:MAG: hypothetical protein J7M05_09215, partial [Anaerolineae bacterium]|nr:hypothetical protein [Anaerolineae bacterium]